jgi:GNAT superfamily N-acetyltransferase
VIDALRLPVVLEAPSGSVVLRRAASDDLAAIMRLLSDDPVSAGRGDVADISDEARYGDALARTQSASGNDVLVAVREDRTIGTLQLTVIPGMARRGSIRLLVEAVRVASEERSGGIGGALMRWVIDAAAPTVNATLIQLTSDAARTDAHRFYTRLGFTDSHVGFKLSLPG